jgi:hypothetical protein
MAENIKLLKAAYRLLTALNPLESLLKSLDQIPNGEPVQGSTKVDYSNLLRDPSQHTITVETLPAPKNHFMANKVRATLRDRQGKILNVLDAHHNGKDATAYLGTLSNPYEFDKDTTVPLYEAIMGHIHNTVGAKFSPDVTHLESDQDQAEAHHRALTAINQKHNVEHWREGWDDSIHGAAPGTPQAKWNEYAPKLNVAIDAEHLKQKTVRAPPPTPSNPTPPIPSNPTPPTPSNPTPPIPSNPTPPTPSNPTPPTKPSNPTPPTPSNPTPPTKPSNPTPTPTPTSPPAPTQSPANPSDAAKPLPKPTTEQPTPVPEQPIAPPVPKPVATVTEQPAPAQPIAPPEPKQPAQPIAESAPVPEQPVKAQEEKPVTPEQLRTPPKKKPTASPFSLKHIFQVALINTDPVDKITKSIQHEPENKDLWLKVLDDKIKGGGLEAKVAQAVLDRLSANKTLKELITLKKAAQTLYKIRQHQSYALRKA